MAHGQKAPSCEPCGGDDAPWLQEMNPLSLLISEMTKMLALSYDIRHPSRYPWLTLLVVHNLSLSTLICLLSDSSSAASLICLLQSSFFSSRSSFFSPSFCFVLTSLWTVEIFFPYFFFFINKKKPYLLLHHLPFCHSPVLLFLLLFSLPWLWVNNCSIVFELRTFLLSSSHPSESWAGL